MKEQEWSSEKTEDSGITTNQEDGGTGSVDTLLLYRCSPSLKRTKNWPPWESRGRSRPSTRVTVTTEVHSWLFRSASDKRKLWGVPDDWRTQANRKINTLKLSIINFLLKHTRIKWRQKSPETKDKPVEWTEKSLTVWLLLYRIYIRQLHTLDVTTIMSALTWKDLTEKPQVKLAVAAEQRSISLLCM